MRSCRDFVAQGENPVHFDLYFAAGAEKSREISSNQPIRG